MIANNHGEKEAMEKALDQMEREFKEYCNRQTVCDKDCNRCVFKALYNANWRKVADDGKTNRRFTKLDHEDRETLQRVIGILEGAMFCAPQKVADAIATAAEMLDAVLDSKGE